MSWMSVAVPNHSTIRLFVVLGAVAALLLGAGAYLYFVGTRTLLEHAEALSFSRP